MPSMLKRILSFGLVLSFLFRFGITNYESDKVREFNTFPVSLYSDSEKILENSTTTYLKNNYVHLPRNLRGSCGYISISLLLSYFDNCINDNIIPENFDDFFAYDDVDDLNIETITSPGVVHEQILSDSLSSNEIRSVISTNEENSLQYELMNMAFENSLSFMHTNNEIEEMMTLNTSEMVNILNYYLSTFVGLNQADYSISVFNYPHQIISFVEKGIPVIGNLSYGSSGGHSVVIYDANGDGDLYAHYGSANRLQTHINIYDDGFTDFEAIVVSLNTTHVHSDNIVDSSGNTRCPCELLYHPYNSDITLNFSNYYKSVSPILSVTDDFAPVSYSYEFVFLERFGRPISRNYILDSVSETTTIPLQEWFNILDLSYEIRYILKRKLVIESISFIYQLDLKINPLPRESTIRANILDELLNFNSWYSSSRERQEIFVGSHKIVTYRKRCGYIENEAIVMSPRKINEGEAYLEFQFDQPIYSFEFNISLWSEREYLSPSDSEATFDYKRNENDMWHETLDLLNDITLSIRTDQYDNYCFYFSNPVSFVRFYSSTSPFGTWNKGRICLHDFIVSYEYENMGAR